MKQPNRIKSIWDNVGESLDRYTILLKGEKDFNQYVALYCSDNPTNPQGVSGWCETDEGSHLGIQIKWSDLPLEVQKYVKEMI